MAPPRGPARADELRPDRAAALLPTPTSSRWQPQRLGLVDLFYYDKEEFPFVDGRLLLRGNNGAGKSKVLALTLPFLLDGDLSPQRVEPDSDRQKRMEWNLLLGDEHPNSERLGYSWLEFGRVDESGEPHFVTIGAGLKAARGRGITRHWFFVTQQRVGQTLDLIDDSRLALGRERLAQALGDAGRVYDTKAEYRHAVDAMLFGLGERRYAELIELLLQIRAPQLSKKPSEAALSEALTRALTPVSEDLIKSVADGLRSLDEERDEVQQLAAAQKAVQGFLQHYRGYAQVMLKRQAVGPRREQSEHDKHGRNLLDVTAELERLSQSLADVATKIDALVTERVSLAAEQGALRDSVHAESERLLELANAAALTAEERAESAKKGFGGARTALDVAETEAEEDRFAVEAAEAHLSEAQVAAAAAALRALLEHEGGAIGALPVDGFEAALERERAVTFARVARRRDALSRVAALIDALEQSEARLTAATKREAESETRLADSSDERTVADTAVDVAVDSYISEVEIMLAGPRELTVSHETFGAFTEWVRLRVAENPALTALRHHALRVHAELQQRSASAQHELGDLATKYAVLEAEIAALMQGESVEPTLPRTRMVAPEGSIPLWRAVSFRDDLDAESRAGLEAALEGSGLLTAVLMPSGDVHEPSAGQLLLRPSGGVESARTLASVLVAAPPSGSAVSVQMIEQVLRGIALVDRDGNSGAEGDSAEVWVSLTGRYRLGSAHGAWSTESARYVGESAREAARDRRLRAARAETDVIVQRQSGLEDELTQIAARTAAVEREQSSVPHPTALELADRVALRAADQVAERAREREEARGRSSEAGRDRDKAAVELAADAGSLQLPTDADTIRGLDAALAEYERIVTEMWGSAVRRADTVRHLSRTNARLAAALAEQTRAGAESAAAKAEQTRSQRYWQSLRAQLGAGVAGYRERVAVVASRLKTIDTDVNGLHEREKSDEAHHAKFAERLRSTRVDQDRAHAARVEAVAALQRTTALGLVQVAALGAVEPEVSGASDWTVTKGVQFARAIEAALPDLDSSDDRYSRLQSQVFTEFADLQRSLGRHGHEAAYYPGDDGVRVVVTFRGREMLLVELGDQLGSQINERQLLLSAKERDIIESHLVTEVGAQLSELIGDAEGQIVQLNQELRSRPTTTGMILRVLWKPRPDGPSGLAEARRRLATTADVWDHDDRMALGAFLQARIGEVRDTDEAGNWYDHLGEALDYRRWHQFTVERQQGGVWKSATGPASGGERVLAASIPLFAAASSHYRTATNPHAPRLIMLDEAFAGVDDSARASCLGLLAEFDLDVVMTSEREWGCYAEVPGLAISQLTRFDGSDAVHVQRWRWDGHRRTSVADAVAVAEAADTGGLW